MKQPWMLGLGLAGLTLVEPSRTLRGQVAEQFSLLVEMEWLCWLWRTAPNQLNWVLPLSKLSC